MDTLNLRAAEKLAAAMDSLPAGVTLCDSNLTVIYMNRTAAKAFAPPAAEDRAEADPGAFIGSNLASCHKPSSLETIQTMLERGITNTYTIRKRGVTKLIFQAPWKDADGSGGLIEISIRLPEKMPHHDRDKPPENTAGAGD